MSYFAYHYSTERRTADRFVEHFGAARDSARELLHASSGYPSTSAQPPGTATTQARSTSFYADIAASIQKVTEEIVLKMARAPAPARRA